MRGGVAAKICKQCLGRTHAPYPIYSLVGESSLFFGGGGKKRAGARIARIIKYLLGRSFFYNATI